MATKGYAAPEVEQCYTRAWELSRHVEESAQLFPVLWGLWAFYETRAEYKRGRELGEQCLTLARSVHDPALLLEAHAILGITLLWLGELALAQEHVEQSLSLYNPQQHRGLAVLYGFDPGVFCLSLAADVLWLLGYPNQALQRSHEALALAQGLSHPVSLALALNFAAVLQQFRRDVPAVHTHAEAAVALSNEQGTDLIVTRNLCHAQQGLGVITTLGVLQPALVL
jgi:predicted ATPase